MTASLEAIVAVIQRLMAKKPQDRYQTPQELLDDLANPNLHRQGVTSDLLASLGKSHDADEYEVEEEVLVRPPPLLPERKSRKSPGREEIRRRRKGPPLLLRPLPTRRENPSSAALSKRKTSELEESLIGQALDEKKTPLWRRSRTARRHREIGRSQTGSERERRGGGISQMSIDPAFHKIGLVILIIGRW